MVNIFNGNKSSRTRRDKKTRSKKRRLKSKSRKRRHRRKKDREERKSSSSSAPSSLTPRREREEYGSANDRKKVDSVNRERDYRKEREEDSAHDDDLSRKKSYTILPRDAPKHVSIKHRQMEEKEVKKCLEKLTERKKEPHLPNVPLDEKSMMLMDRINKKAFPMKFLRLEVWNPAHIDDDDYFKPTVTKTSSLSIVIPGDTYDHVPKLSVVNELPDENVYLPNTRQPFWTKEPLEPDDEEMKDTELPISVGTDHVEQYQDKKLTLKHAKDTKLLLDEWAPLATLENRDEDHFHPHLVFSNTVRSLVNVQAEFATQERPAARRNNGNEEATQVEQESLTATISKEKPRRFHYSRSNPILSARGRLDSELPRSPSSKSYTESICAPSKDEQYDESGTSEEKEEKE